MSRLISVQHCLHNNDVYTKWFIWMFSVLNFLVLLFNKFMFFIFFMLARISPLLPQVSLVRSYMFSRARRLLIPSECISQHRMTCEFSNKTRDATAGKWLWRNGWNLQYYTVIMNAVRKCWLYVQRVGYKLSPVIS